MPLTCGNRRQLSRGGTAADEPSLSGIGGGMRLPRPAEQRAGAAWAHFMQRGSQVGPHAQSRSVGISGAFGGASECGVDDGTDDDRERNGGQDDQNGYYLP